MEFVEEKKGFGTSGGILKGTPPKVARESFRYASGKTSGATLRAALGVPS